jgi:hypothetical protein
VFSFKGSEDISLFKKDENIFLSLMKTRITNKSLENNYFNLESILPI